MRHVWVRGHSDYAPVLPGLVINWQYTPVHNATAPSWTALILVTPRDGRDRQLKTGTFRRAASILIRSGFDHRAAAVAAVTSTEATFESMAGMREWIRDLDPGLTRLPDWPTAESHAAWLEFTNRAGRSSPARWAQHVERIEDVTWYDSVPEPNAWLRVTDAVPSKVELWSTGFDILGEAHVDINPRRQGVLYARRLPDTGGVALRYRGPGDLITPVP